MNRYAALLVILLIAVPVAAFAGPNQGAALLASAGSVTKSTPATCAFLGGRICSQLTPAFMTQEAPLLSVVAVYVGRIPALPAISGVDFGIQYNPNALYLPAWTHCGSLEVNGTNWPQPGSGNTVVWTSPQAGETVLVGYFTMAKYSAGYTAADHNFTLGAHPLYGTARVTDGSNFDDLRYPAVANLSGDADLGRNPDCAPISVRPTTWGNIKNLYQN
jgi:hypothetical protein